MENEPSLDHVLDFARPALSKIWLHHLRTRTRILFVVDTEISLSPGAAAFGVERVIRLLRSAAVGCLRFSVDVALRSNAAFSVVSAPAGTDAKYLGFRFDSVLPNGNGVLGQYDQVWCFAFKPGNDNGPDSSIHAPFALPASDSELAVLTQWMNEGGGVFATGDHDFLGASMCHRIPRIGTMRAWTNAQGVPPIGTPQRIDTNRPGNVAEAAGTEEIEFDRQGDAVPQVIDWVPWMSYRHPFLPSSRVRRPHPVLCHPKLGPIDVMPDHPHEGVVFDHLPQPDVALAAITLGNAYDFGAGVAGPEYPTHGSVRPLPQVIAHGRTLADPPLIHEKGDSPAKRFAMISVYDGHRAHVGRVATDSTWHHWMNINITELETAGGDNWEKIQRYYVNLATWLARANTLRHCFHFHLLESFYSYPGIEEFRPKADIMQLGTAFSHYLGRYFGPCWVNQYFFDVLGVLDVDLRERLIDRYLSVPSPKRPIPGPPNPCLSCPPPDAVQSALLGGVVRAAAEALLGDGKPLEESLKHLADFDADSFEKRIIKGGARGIESLSKQYRQSFEETKGLLQL